MNQAHYQVQPQVPVFFYQKDAENNMKAEEKKTIFSLKNVVIGSVAIIASLLIIIAVFISNKGEHKSETFDTRSVRVRVAKSNDGGINSFEPPKKTVSSTPVTVDKTNANDPSITKKQKDLSISKQPKAYPDYEFNTAPSNYNSSSISAPVTDSLADASIDDATDDIVAADLIDVKVEKTIPESFFDMDIDLLVFFDKVQEMASSCLCNIYSYDPSNMELKVVNTFKVNSSCINIDLIISSDRKKIAFNQLGSIFLRNITDKSDSESKLVFTRDYVSMGLISDLCFSPNGEEIGFVGTCRSGKQPVPQIFKIKIVDLNDDKVKESLVKISNFQERRDLRNLTFVSDELFAFRECESNSSSYFSLIKSNTITDLKSFSNSDSNNNRLFHYFIYSEESQTKIILLELHKKGQKKEIQIFSVSIDSVENIIENESNNQTSLLPIERVNLAVINESFLRPILSSKGNFILYQAYRNEIYKVIPLKPSALNGSVQSSESKSISEIQILDLKSADQN